MGASFTRRGAEPTAHFNRSSHETTVDTSLCRLRYAGVLAGTLFLGLGCALPGTARDQAYVRAPAQVATLTLTRGGCSGKCESYRAALHESGVVLFEGQSPMLGLSGERRGQLSPAQFRELVERIQRVLPDSLLRYYDAGHDLPFTRLELTSREDSMSVMSIGVADELPSAVIQVHDMVDSAVSLAVLGRAPSCMTCLRREALESLKREAGRP